MAILISIKPEWVEKILNGKKAIEIRKTMPKCSLPCKVYIYCTKGQELWRDGTGETWHGIAEDEDIESVFELNPTLAKLNGKVVAEFTLDKVDSYECELYHDANTYQLISKFTIDEEDSDWRNYEHGAENNESCEMLENACLSWDELRDYLGDGIHDCYAWHITDLKVYDNPKELSEFKRECDGNCLTPKKVCVKIKNENRDVWCDCSGLLPVTRPPQSYMFCEDLEE